MKNTYLFKFSMESTGSSIQLKIKSLRFDPAPFFLFPSPSTHNKEEEEMASYEGGGQNVGADGFQHMEKQGSLNERYVITTLYMVIVGWVG
jgi:hypothetical protein